MNVQSYLTIFCILIIITPLNCQIDINSIITIADQIETKFDSFQQVTQSSTLTKDNISLLITKVVPYFTFINRNINYTESTITYSPIKVTFIYSLKFSTCSSPVIDFSIPYLISNTSYNSLIFKVEKNKILHASIIGEAYNFTLFDFDILKYEIIKTTLLQMKEEIQTQFKILLQKYLDIICDSLLGKREQLFKEYLNDIESNGNFSISSQICKDIHSIVFMNFNYERTDDSSLFINVSFDTKIQMGEKIKTARMEIKTFEILESHPKLGDLVIWTKDDFDNLTDIDRILQYVFSFKYLEKDWFSNRK